MIKPLGLLFGNSTQEGKLQQLRLKQMLYAYRAASRSVPAIDDLEKGLRGKLWLPPVIHTKEEFALSLEAAILSLRGWLLAFSVAALILLSLSAGLRDHNQSPAGLEDVLTYNADTDHRDSVLFSDEMDYDR